MFPIPMNEIAIWVPPPAACTLAPDEALARCRAYLVALGADPKAVEQAPVYDDREAVVTITEGLFFPKTEGEAPAWTRMVSDGIRRRLRAAVIPERRSLRGAPNSSNDLLKLETNTQRQFELVEAALALAIPPSEEELDALHGGNPEAWHRVLAPLSWRPPFIRSFGAPAAVAQVMLERDSVQAWSAIASRVAGAALPDQVRTQQTHAIGHFKDWLRDGERRARATTAKKPAPVEASAPVSPAVADEPEEALGEESPVRPTDPREVAYWACLASAHQRLASGEWAAAAAKVEEAKGLRDPDPEDGVPPYEVRLEAGVHFGQGDFAMGWKRFNEALMLEMLLPPFYQPETPSAHAPGETEVEDALRSAVFLLVSAANRYQPADALDRLAKALPPDQAEALNESTQRRGAGPGRAVFE